MASRDLCKIRGFVIGLVAVATIDWVVKKSADVMNEEGIEEFGDLFFIGEIESAFVGDPRRVV